MVIGVIFMLVAGGWLTLEIIRTPHIETVVTFLLPHKECQIVTSCIKCLIKKYVKKSLLLGGYNIEEEEIENYITQTLNSSIKTGKSCLYYIFDEYFKKRNYIDLELWQLRISRKGLKITDTLMEYIQFGVTLIQIKIAINGPSLTDETNPGLYFMMFMLIIVETLIMVYNNTEKQNSSDNTVLQIADELLIRQNPLYNK